MARLQEVGPIMPPDADDPGIRQRSTSTERRSDSTSATASRARSPIPLRIRCDDGSPVSGPLVMEGSAGRGRWAARGSRYRQAVGSYRRFRTEPTTLPPRPWNAPAQVPFGAPAHEFLLGDARPNECTLSR